MTLLLIALSGVGLSQVIPYHPFDWCNTVEPGDYAGQATQLTYGYECIVDESNSTTSIEMQGNESIEIKAGESIFLNGELDLRPNTGDVFMHIEKSDIEVVWFEPYATPQYVGKYEMLEIGLKLPTVIEDQVDAFLAGITHGLNPYDPDDIDINVRFYKEGDLTVRKRREAFFTVDHQRTTATDWWEPLSTEHRWRIRFAPDEVGSWEFDFDVSVNGTQIHSSGRLSFECTNTDRKGFVKSCTSYTNENCRYLWHDGTNETFFPVGINTCWTHKGLNNAANFGVFENDRVVNWIKEIKAGGGNYCSVGMIHYNYYPEWNDLDNYTTRQPAFEGLDEIFETLEDERVYTQFWTEFHGNLNDAADGGYWSQNPYRVELPSVVTQDDFFGDPTARKFNKMKYRYTMSRWGYSPYIAVLELHSEVGNDGTHYHEPGSVGGASRVKFNDWFSDTKDYIEFDMDCDYVITASTAEGATELMNQKYDQFTDVVMIHKYGEEKNENYHKRYQQREKFRKKSFTKYKPVIWDELGILHGNHGGIYCATDIDFHNTIWSTSFMGTFGSGQHWWWDRGLLDLDYQEHFLELTKFFENEQLHNRQYQYDKWRDRGGIGMDATKIETMYIHSKDRDRALGWVHNATAYWRNLHGINTRINELVTQNYVSDPCILDDGVEIGCYDDPTDDQGCIKSGTNYGSNAFTDDYTALGNPTLILSHDKQIKIKHLRWNPVFFDRPFYEVTWYRTRVSGTSGIEIVKTETVGVEPFSRTLRLDYPNLTVSQDYDYAYKIQFVGFNKSNSPSDSIAKPSKSESHNDTVIQENFRLFPNPTTGLVTIQDSSPIGRLVIYDVLGNVVFDKVINERTVELLLNEPAGIYFVARYNNNKVETIKLILE